jgi:hypothetical protein
MHIGRGANHGRGTKFAPSSQKVDNDDATRCIAQPISQRQSFLQIVAQRAFKRPASESAIFCSLKQTAAFLPPVERRGSFSDGTKRSGTLASWLMSETKPLKERGVALNCLVQNSLTAGLLVQAACLLPVLADEVWASDFSIQQNSRQRARYNWSDASVAPSPGIPSFRVEPLSEELVRCVAPY